MKLKTTFLTFIICSLVWAQEKPKTIKSGVITMTNNEQVQFSNLRYEDDKVYYMNTQTQLEEHLYLSSILSIDSGGVMQEVESSTTTTSPVEEVITIEQDLPQLTFISSTRLQLGNRILKVDDVYDYLQDYPTALELYHKGRRQRAWGNTLIGLGSTIIILNGIRNLAIANKEYTQEQIISGNTKSGTPVPFFIGFGVIGASIPLLISGKKNIKEAVNEYNSNPRVNVTLNVIGNQNGMGIALRF